MICITFDTDHINDKRMEKFLNEIFIPGEATFFCTRRFKALDDLDQHHEVALHPCFDGQQDWMKIVNELRSQWPSEKAIYGVRAHSCMYSQRLGVQLANTGYKYVSHVSVPANSGLQPFLYPWGIYEMPIHYMDNMDFTHNKVEVEHTPFSQSVIQHALQSPNAFIFDFHPLHLLINTPSTEEYSKWWKDGCPEHFVAAGYGVRSFFDDLVRQMKAADQKSYRLSTLLPRNT